MSAVRRVFLEVLGWALVIGGIAALVLPGPGLLALFAGLVLLSQQYAWAERRVEPVKERAVKAAADGVQTWPRIALSALGALCLVGAGIVWGIRPAAPGWWPIADRWWLVGGWAAGVTLIVSGVLAGAMIMYAFRRYRKPGQPGISSPHPTDPATELEDPQRTGGGGDHHADRGGDQQRD